MILSNQVTGLCYGSYLLTSAFKRQNELTKIIKKLFKLIIKKLIIKKLLKSNNTMV